MASQSITTVNITSVYPAAQQVGLDVSNLPAGTTPDALVKLIQAKLAANLLAGWKSATSFGTNQDSGIMGPWASNIGGTAPACLTAQLNLDFQAWLLPVDVNTINLIAEEITEQIAASGGNYRTFYGNRPEGPAAQIVYGVACVASVISDDNDEQGIIYAFAAVADLS